MDKKESDELLSSYERQKSINFFLDEYQEESVDELDSLSMNPTEKYDAEIEIDEGGMKKIYQVFDKNSTRNIAIARLKDDKNSKIKKNFIREARLTALLEHPNIVPVHDVGLDPNGSPYFSMKLIEGETLSDILHKLRDGDQDYLVKYSRPVLIDVFLKVCEAIAFAHSRGIIHLDLKPANIRVSDYGEVLVIDWGLAKFLDEFEEDSSMSDMLISSSTTHTIYGVIKGTIGYMAPEQAKGENRNKGRHTDIYALGAILYSILTYTTPIVEDDIEIDEVVILKVERHLLPLV